MSMDFMIIAITSHTVLILEILKCGGSSPHVRKMWGLGQLKWGTCTSAKEGLISETFVCIFVSTITQMLLYGSL